TVAGQDADKPRLEESWLLFSKAVSHADGVQVGYVELAFELARDEGTERRRIAPIRRSPLVVFFPTVVETHLGFLVQGPIEQRRVATTCRAMTNGTSTVCRQPAT